MAVYIDNFNAPYRNMVMCHMIADTQTELLEMVDKIGVHRSWIQHEGTPKEHFDVCQAKKKKAIKLGAIEIPYRKLVEKIKARRVYKIK